MNLFENLQLMKETNSNKSIDEMKHVIELFYNRHDSIYLDKLLASYNVTPENSVTIFDGLSDANVKEIYNTLYNHIVELYGPDYDELNTELINVLNLNEGLESYIENNDMESIKNYWVYKEIIENDYQVEITDESLTIRFPKPDNDIYAHYTFRYDEDFEDWLVYFHGDKPERKGELIIDDLESISSYESVVKGCLYNFWNTH